MLRIDRARHDVLRAANRGRSRLLVRLRRASRLAALALLLCGGGTRADAPPGAGSRLVTDAELIARVLELADERLAMMPDVACAKEQARLPLVDAAREAAVIAATERAARLVGLDAEDMGALMRVQVDVARAAQTRVAGPPRTRTRAAPAPDLPARTARALERECPSLDALRARLDAWTPTFVRAVQLAVAPLQVGAADGLLAAVAADRLASPRWSARDRDALVSALAAVRMRVPATLSRARAVGVLRIGTPADYAPFAVERNGVLRGSDVELAVRIASSLGLEPVFVHTSWRTLADDLRKDRFDVAVGGISVTPDRDAVGDFALPHARGGKTAIGRCADVARLRSLATIDRATVRVIVNPGGTNERFVRAHVRRAHVRVHPDNRTIFDEIVAGRADAMFTDDTEVALQTRRHPQLCRLVRRTWMPADKALLLQADPALRAAVDAWLAPAIARGLPQRLLEHALADPSM